MVMVWDSKMLRHAIIGTVRSIAARSPNNYDAHMASAHVEFYLRDRSGTNRPVRWAMAKTAHDGIVGLMEALPQSKSCLKAHELVHQLMDRIYSQMNDAEKQAVASFLTPEGGVDESEDENKKLLEEHSDDFDKWAADLASGSEPNG